MRFVLVRSAFASETVGKLMVLDGEKQVVVYNTLELPWRDNNKNISCIPDGDYNVYLAKSEKFNREVYLLANVPGRSGILIHDGANKSDTEGCILLRGVSSDEYSSNEELKSGERCSEHLVRITRNIKNIKIKVITI
jgi:hypothetical protein